MIGSYLGRKRSLTSTLIDTFPSSVKDRAVHGRVSRDTGTGGHISTDPLTESPPRASISTQNRDCITRIASGAICGLCYYATAGPIAPRF